jgi:hypothetical protein
VESKLLSTALEKFRAEEATMWIESNQTPFMTKAEVDLRMQHADGTCPMCGILPSISAEANERGHHHVFTSCQHFPYTDVQDLDGCMRRVSTFSGNRWPYLKWSNEKIADDRGQPLEKPKKLYFSSHCGHCRELDAKAHFTRELETLFTGWMDDDKPEWSYNYRPDREVVGPSPVTELHGRFLPCSAHADGRRDHIRRLVRRMVNGDLSEFRLNNAGLKLYVHGVDVPLDYLRGKLTFSVNVGGDQRESYAAFVEHANRQIRDRNLWHFSYPQEA